ncbi:RTX family hemolysin [Actinobacillus equuli]|uniref:RTX family hemolysin n=1 Tax=Actinobacillus equuli TaxID=718 RepID=UPI002442AC8E|nr:RTX family hemolysin [Actinobacillus equuli]WGE52884.1 RTX family hemolysin [Actinobacillus equuli subsp. haemolyticus]
MSKVANVLSQVPKSFGNLNLQFQQGAGKIKSGVQKGYQSSKQHLSQAGAATKNYANKLILYIPKEYDATAGNGLKGLLDAAEALGIEVQREEKDGVATAYSAFGVGEQFIGLTERGLTLFLPQLDNFLKKHPKFSKSIGDSSEKVLGNVGNAKLILSGIQSVLGTTLAGIELDNLIKEGGSKTELAQAGINLVNELVGNIAKGAETIQAFSDQLAHLGSYIQNTKGLGGLGNKLQNISGSALNKAGLGFDIVSSLLSGVSAGFALADPNASTGKKIAAGFELSNQVIGGITKAVSGYILAQRIASGLSTTGPAIGLIASSISLAISPLAFLNVADKFNYAKEINKFAERFKKFGYEGDSLLADFHHESGAIDASITTINTALGAISAGVTAAGAASLVGAPVTLLVGGITGLISAILDLSKQAMFEHVATKLSGKIEAWEKKYGMNYFEKGYDARHAAFLEDNFAFFESLTKELRAERVISITQQQWDAQIGDLAGITRRGDKIQSGKAYVDVFKESKEDRNYDNIVTFDPTEGIIDISKTTSKTQHLLFLNPLLTPGKENREREKKGKYEYVTKLIVDRKTKWQVTDGEASSTLDFTNVLQFIAVDTDRAGNVTESLEAKIEAKLGKGDDTVFVGWGSTDIDGSEGYDRAAYNRLDGEAHIYGLNIDAQQETVAGSYTVNRTIGRGAAKHEVIKVHQATAGKRVDKIEYRQGESRFHNELKVVDKLVNVEEIIGTKNQDIFKGSKFNDTFFGGDEKDIIYGNAGNDRLFGGNGNDEIDGGDGNDFIDGGKGNDSLTGGYGNDIYVIHKEDGQDFITELGGDDRLVFTDTELSRLTFKRDKKVLIIEDSAHNNQVRISDWFFKDQATLNKEYHAQSALDKDYRIEEIIDKNGTRITADQIDTILNGKSEGVIEVSQLVKISDDYKAKVAADNAHLSEIAEALGKIASSSASFSAVTGGAMGSANAFAAVSENALNNKIVTLFSSYAA